MSVAIYPGSFDPITLGHIDIISRVSKLFDNLIVAVLTNKNKKCMFTLEERVNMIKQETECFNNVQVDSFDGLLVDFVNKKNANIIIRGLRAVTDYEYEIQLAQTNKVLNNQIETLFINTNLKYSYLSSSVVKEILMFGGDISHFVTPNVEQYIKNHYNK